MSTGRQRTTPARLRLSTLAMVALAIAVAVVTALSMTYIRDQVRIIGLESAPQASTAAQLYYTLSDLDAQVTRLVLIGNSPAHAGSQIDALTTYRERSRQLDDDLERALVTAAQDDERALIRTLVEDLTSYREYAWRALAVVWQPPAREPGELPEASRGYYAQATNVLHNDLLPTAQQLRTISADRLDGAYAAQRNAIVWGSAAVLVLGGLLVLLMIWQQRWLARQFNRRLNPALLVATVLTGALLVWAALVPALAGLRLDAGRRDGLAPYLALTGVQAVSHNAASDASRYLLSGNLERYRGDVTRRSVTDGLTAEVALSPATRDELLRRWQAYEEGHLRILAFADADQPDEAVAALTGIRRGEATFDFYYFDVAISEAASARRDTFEVALRDSTTLLTGAQVLPLLAFGVVIVLVPTGLRARLAEYR